MNIPKLQLQSSKALLELNIQKPVQEIQQPKADLDLQQPKAKLTIETTKSKLTIDSFLAREDMGFKSTIRRTAEIAQQGKEEALDGIGRTAQEGNQMMRIENGGNPIASIAKSRGRQPYSGLGIKFIPSSDSVKIHFEPGRVDIKVELHKVINNTTINKPIHNYTPGKVKVEMSQVPSLKIDWIV
ncbi:DUF6470 family protein [Ureibacillus composti]|nr:DUF6470 family protein [Ureibacillus composti]